MDNIPITGLCDFSVPGYSEPLTFGLMESFDYPVLNSGEFNSSYYIIKLDCMKEVSRWPISQHFRLQIMRSWVRIPLRISGVAKWLALLASDLEVLGSNPTGGRIQLMTVQHFIEQSLSLSPFHHLHMT